MRFDLADLSLFRHVVEAGSITHGAERAHLALAAASTRIRNMEEALGAPLLMRGRQGVTPTQAGRTLLQHARTILRQAERLREDLGAYARRARRPGPGAVQHQCADRIPARGAELVPRRASQVSVDLEERLSDEIVGLIAEGVADIGIVAGTVDAGALETYPFRSDRFVLVVARDHPLAQARQDRLRGGARPRFRRPRPRQRAAALPRRQGRAHRPAAAAARAVAQLRRGLPAGRMQCRHRHRAGDHGAPRGEDHGDRDRAD